MSETLLNTNQNQLNNDDGSFVELIQTVQNGKAKLAQAIIDKGGNVSVASSYDQMAQAVNNLQVADGKGSFLVQGFYDLKSNGTYNVLDLISATFLPHHNALVGVTTEGKINIYRVNDAGNALVAIASVSTGLTVSKDAKYINFGFNRSETKIVFYDSNSSNKFLVVMSMDWTNNTLEILLNYTVQGYMGGGSGRNTYSGNNEAHYSYGITINESGSHIAYLGGSGYTNKYLSILIPNYSDGTVIENIGFEQSGYAYSAIGSVYYICNSVYYLDIENSVIEGIDPYSCLFKFNIDLTGTYPKITNYINTHPMMTSNPENQCSYPLIIKDIDSTLDCYVHYISSSATKGTLYLKKYTGNEDILYDSITFNTNFNAIKTTYGLDNITDSYYIINNTTSYYNINYYIKNNEIYLLLPSNIIVKIDNNGPTPKLVVSNSNNVKVNNEYLSRRTTETESGYQYWYAKLYSTIDTNKVFLIGRNFLNSYQGSGATGPSTSGLNYFMEYREPCVLAQKYIDSQGNEYFSAPDFNMSTYEAGGYRLYNEASILTEDA